ncbi:hypothetical protein C2G38_2029841 [Gigaspora rosea]|uniref:Uncharacterized protein n=1 Tax=Gigaspora rosea TaxID=44941 RepID=A0A397VY61_9GLOM|nr:hypothetical protein C2G38_2029841 [Gigaspora rosea]
MDDNFVKFAATNEPSYGIEKNKWIFKTASRTVPEQYSDKAIGVVRLTQDVNLWDELKWKLLGLLIGCIILLAIALWARFKYPEILYYIFTVKYEAIPFLTLLTGSIALLNSIILKLFKYFSSKEESLH